MATTMHFGPEWMRTKQLPSRAQLPPSPPPTFSVPPSSASTYSALVSSAPVPQLDKCDEVYPFRYSKEDMLTIYKEGGGRGGLGLEVERWKGIVREVGSEPIGLREMSDTEKKLFASSLNSDLRRRQSNDYLSSLALQGSTGERPRPNNSAATPMRERFGSVLKRKGIDQPPPTTSGKLSLSSGQGPLPPPRDPSLPSSRTQIGPFNGILKGGDSWVSRRRASEGLQRAGARGELGNAEYPPESKGLEIREEEEQENLGLQATAQETSNIARQSLPEPDPGSIVHSKTEVLNGIEHLSLHAEASPSTEDDMGSTTTRPPSGIPDLASIDWSYLDPQGQVQGPFRADLMQKWYDDGYFTPDLLMKRTHHDIEWTPVRDLSRRSGGNKMFLCPTITPPVPPGLSIQADSPQQGFATPVDQITFQGPYQPAPVRSLRVSTLDSYLGTPSNLSDVSSSFSGGRFRDTSPDLAAFGGRVGNDAYSLDPSVSGRTPFSVAEPSPVYAGGRRSAFNDPSLDPSLTFHSSPFGNPTARRASTIDSYHVDGMYGCVQPPWPASGSNLAGSGFDGMNGGSSSTDAGSFSSSFASGSLNQAGNAHLPQDTSQDHSSANAVFPPPECNVGEFKSLEGVARSEADDNSTSTFNSYPNGLGHTSFGQNHQYAGSPSVPYAVSVPQPQQSSPASAATYHDTVNTQKTVLPLASQHPTNATTQMPWNSPAGRKPGPFDPLHPTSLNTLPIIPSQPTPWGLTSQHSQPASLPIEPSPWFNTSQGIVGESWKELPGSSSLTFSNVGQHNQLQQVLASPVDRLTIVPASSNQPQQQSYIGYVSATSLEPSSAATKFRRKSVAHTSPTPAPPNTITEASTVRTPSPAPAQSKLPAWLNEDETKMKSPGATLSLRDIQEAEAKKVEARRATERDRERVARAVAPTPIVNEESLGFTASWGLPTSQAGAARNTGQKDVSTSSNAVASTAPVWVNSVKSQQTKKSMKEIQEEEEKRKKAATKETSAMAAARRAHPESMNKAIPSISVAGSAWTTVGHSGKNATPATRPPLTSPSFTMNMSGSTDTTRAKVLRSPLTSAVKVSTSRNDDHPTVPSHDFLKWLSDSLKGLNSSVNVEEIVSMLLSFPLEPDSSTTEIISEMIYANSTMLDGRRFASEFVSRRKIDAASRPRAVGVPGSVAKPISIADVVKTQPKPAQQEWGGFKVVNKKKKTGR